MRAAKMPFAVVVSLAIALTRVSGKDLVWKKYVNARFGFSTEYPASLVASVEPLNGGGCEYHSANWEFSVAAFGQFLMKDDGETFESHRRDEVKSLGSTITYQASGPHWYVVSGVAADGTEYYHKFYVHGRNSVTLQITYPHARNGIYNAWVTHIEKSFVPFLKGDYDRAP